MFVFVFLLLSIVSSQQDLYPKIVTLFLWNRRDQVFINGEFVAEGDCDENCKNDQGWVPYTIEHECIHVLAVRGFSGLYSDVLGEGLGILVKNKNGEVLYRSWDTNTHSTPFRCSFIPPTSVLNYYCPECDNMPLGGLINKLDIGEYQGYIDPLFLIPTLADNDCDLVWNAGADQDTDIAVCRLAFDTHFYTWDEGDWGDCQTNGFQTRQVQCLHDTDVLSNSCCNVVGTMPDTQQWCGLPVDDDPTPTEPRTSSAILDFSSIILWLGVGCAFVTLVMVSLFFIRHRKRKIHGSNYNFRTMFTSAFSNGFKTYKSTSTISSISSDFSSSSNSSTISSVDTASVASSVDSNAFTKSPIIARKKSNSDRRNIRKPSSEVSIISRKKSSSGKNMRPDSTMTLVSVQNKPFISNSRTRKQSPDARKQSSDATMSLSIQKQPTCRRNQISRKSTTSRLRSSSPVSRKKISKSRSKRIRSSSPRRQHSPSPRF